MNGSTTNTLDKTDSFTNDKSYVNINIFVLRVDKTSTPIIEDHKKIDVIIKNVL